MNILKRTMKKATRGFTGPVILLGVVVALPASLGIMAEVLEEPGTLSHVLKTTECKPWSGAFPSAVILQRVPGGDYYLTRNDRKIGKALGEKIDGQVWASHDVVELCR